MTEVSKRINALLAGNPAERPVIGEKNSEFSYNFEGGA